MDRETSLDLFREQFDGIERRPMTVLRQTDDVLDFYFNPDFPTSKHLSDYLSEYTLPFLGQIRDGANVYRQRSRKLGWKYLNTLKNATSHAIAQNPQDEFHDAIEAFDLALVTFTTIPREYSLGIGGEDAPKSTRGMFRPPYTIDEFMRRTVELHSFITGVIDQDVPRDDTKNYGTGHIRARAFFEVGSEIPLTQNKL